MGYYQTQNYMEDRHCPVAPTEANSYVNTTCVHAVYSLIAPWITMSRVAEVSLTHSLTHQTNTITASLKHENTKTRHVQSTVLYA